MTPPDKRATNTSDDNLPEVGGDWDLAAGGKTPAQSSVAFDFGRILQLDQFIRVSFFAALLPVVLMLAVAGYYAFQLGYHSPRMYLIVPGCAIAAMITIGKGLLLRHPGYRWGVFALYLVCGVALALVSLLKVHLDSGYRIAFGIGAMLCGLGVLAVLAHHLLLKQADATSMPNRFNEVMGFPLKRGDLVATVEQMQRSAQLNEALNFRRGEVDNGSNSTADPEPGNDT